MTWACASANIAFCRFDRNSAPGSTPSWAARYSIAATSGAAETCAASPAGLSDGQATRNETAPLTYEQLTDMWSNGLPAGVAPYHARQILENAIRTATTQAARDLKNFAANPQITPVDLLTTAVHRIDRAAHQETRWRASHPLTSSQPYDQALEQQDGTRRGV